MAKNKLLKSPNNNQATQSNHLIEASYRMSVAAKRVMLLLLSQIHPGQREVHHKIRIEASDYAQRTGVSSSQAYQDIKNGALELQKTIITTRDTKAKTTEHCVVISWVKYHANEGWLEATFTQWLAPYIHHLQKIGYTTISVDDALKFKRFYTVRFYELLMQFQKTEERYITIENLKQIFQIEKNKYPAFKDFRTRVLEPSIKETEEKTSWRIAWEPVKTGRKITSISLVFENGSQTDLAKTG